MKKFYFTLGSNHGGPGCVEVVGTDYNDARERMCRVWGRTWAFQYESLEEVHPNDRRIVRVIGGEE